MNRRGFLQSILAAGVAPAFIPFANLMKPTPTGILVPEQGIITRTPVGPWLDQSLRKVYRGMMITGIEVQMLADRAVYTVYFLGPGDREASSKIATPSHARLQMAGTIQTDNNPGLRVGDIVTIEEEYK